MQLKLALDKNGSLDEQCAVEVGNSGDSLMALSSSDVAVHDLTSVQRAWNRRKNRVCEGDT